MSLAFIALLPVLRRRRMVELHGIGRDMLGPEGIRDGGVLHLPELLHRCDARGAPNVQGLHHFIRLQHPMVPSKTCPIWVIFEHSWGRENFNTSCFGTRSTSWHR